MGRDHFLSSFREARKRLTARFARLMHGKTDEEVSWSLPFSPAEKGKPTIVFAGMLKDYGRHGRGLGYEVIHLVNAFIAEGYGVIHFPFDEIAEKYGYQRLQKILESVCCLRSPDLLFHMTFQEEIFGETLRRISSVWKVPTLAWFSDDNWRFDSYSSHKAFFYDWVCTTYPEAFEGYERMGHKGAILTQWGVNHRVFRPLGGDDRYPVSFVGQSHGDRKVVISHLRSSGLSVDVWGRGWENGRIDTAKMVEVFSRSSINLNLSNSSSVQCSIQIKGRDFEVPACGGFLLTQRHPRIGEFYREGEEIETYSNLEELKCKIFYYLNNKDDANKIRKNGLARTLKDHTYKKRFEDIFKIVFRDKPHFDRI